MLGGHADWPACKPRPGSEQAASQAGRPSWCAQATGTFINRGLGDSSAAGLFACAELGVVAGPRQQQRAPGAGGGRTGGWQPASGPVHGQSDAVPWTFRKHQTRPNALAPSCPAPPPLRHPLAPWSNHARPPQNCMPCNSTGTRAAQLAKHQSTVCITAKPSPARRGSDHHAGTTSGIGDLCAPDGRSGRLIGCHQGRITAPQPPCGPPDRPRSRCWTQVGGSAAGLVPHHAPWLCAASP